MMRLVPIAAALLGLALLSAPPARAGTATPCADLALPTLDATAAPRLLLLGEVHGTVEIPALVGDLLCQPGWRSARVALALEFDPLANQAAVDTYLREGSAEAERALLATPLWQERGGRASAAMFALLSTVREHNRNGARIEVIGIDPVRVDAPTAIEREAAMAASLITLMRTHERVIALTGFAHANRGPITLGDTPIPSAASFLPNDGVITLRPLPLGGEAWYCAAPAPGEAEVCGVQRGPARVAVEPRGVYLDGKRFPGFDGYYSSGRAFSASPPKRP